MKQYVKDLMKNVRDATYVKYKTFLTDLILELEINPKLDYTTYGRDKKINSNYFIVLRKLNLVEMIPIPHEDGRYKRLAIAKAVEEDLNYYSRYTCAALNAYGAGPDKFKKFLIGSTANGGLKTVVNTEEPDLAEKAAKVIEKFDKSPQTDEVPKVDPTPTVEEKVAEKLENKLTEALPDVIRKKIKLELEIEVKLNWV